MKGMLKTEAIKLLGGTASAAASAIGVTPQAVAGWPDELPRRIEDRVLAALYRQQQGAKPRLRVAQDNSAPHRPAARRISPDHRGPRCTPTPP